MIGQRIPKTNVYFAYDRSVDAYQDRKAWEDVDEGWNVPLITSYPDGCGQTGKWEPAMRNKDGYTT